MGCGKVRWVIIGYGGVGCGKVPSGKVRNRPLRAGARRGEIK